MAAMDERKTVSERILSSSMFGRIIRHFVSGRALPPGLDLPWLFAIWFAHWK
jgi:hypothetical protein